MAAKIPVVSQSSQELPLHPQNMISIKKLAESPNLTSVPSAYTFTKDPHELTVSDPDVPIPTIDYSLLTSGTPHQRSKVVEELGQACKEWGFFMVINHGVPESLRKAMIGACEDFFDLQEEEKKKYAGKHVLDPIRAGTSFNTSTDIVFLWKDYLKIFVHPQFHSPDKPDHFREILSDYCRTIRTIAWELLKGISESLGLEELYIHKAMDLQNSCQLFVANFYPPCPQPEWAMGMPPHSDHGLLTLLTQNDVGGLHVQHEGKWVKIDPIPNSFLVNTGDHLEIMSNGKYKSVLHRAVVNNKVLRISLATANSPSLDAVVRPAPELLDNECHLPAYKEMKFGDYLEAQQSRKLGKKTGMDLVRIERC